MDILRGKRVGGEIVEQGWIVSVPWGIVPGGDLRTAEGGRGEGVSCESYNYQGSGKHIK